MIPAAHFLKVAVLGVLLSGCAVSPDPAVNTTHNWLQTCQAARTAYDIVSDEVLRSNLGQPSVLDGTLSDPLYVGWTLVQDQLLEPICATGDYPSSQSELAMRAHGALDRFLTAKLEAGL